MGVEVIKTMSIPVSENVRGTNLSRLVRALALSHGKMHEAVSIAREWRDSPAVYLTLEAMTTKAAVPAGTTTDTGFAAELHQYAIDAEAFELYRSRAALGRASGLMRATPLLTKVAKETTDTATVDWLPESGLKPVRALSLDTLSLDPFKLTAMVVLTQELVRMSTPSAEATVRRILIDAIASFIDAQFLSSNAAVANESPAGIANGQPSVGTTGDTAAAIGSDLGDMAGNLGSWLAPAWFMRPRTLCHLAARDLVDFLPGGPMLLGFPIFTTVASPAQIMLLDCGSVLLGDDGATSIELSRQSTIAMDDGGSPATATLISMWQNDLVAIRAERYISWLPCHSAVAVVMSISY